MYFKPLYIYTYMNITKMWEILDLNRRGYVAQSEKVYWRVFSIAIRCVVAISVVISHLYGWRVTES